MNTNLTKIGKLLSLRRKNKGLTQDEVGSMIGVQKAMVSKVENGLRPIKKPDKDIIDYVMTAIIEFAKKYGLTIREASNYLNRFKGIDFLTEFYDVEHTLSFNDCVDDLTVVCKNMEGK